MWESGVEWWSGLEHLKRRRIILLPFLTEGGVPGAGQCILSQPIPPPLLELSLILTH